MTISTPSLAYKVAALAIIAGVLVDSAAAFAPVHHSSPVPLRTASSRATSAATPSATPSATATALHANLFDRFFRVSRAGANNILQRFEDPEKIMTQALEDMQNDLLRVRQTYSEVTAAQRRLASSRDQLESQAGDWHDRAQLALRRSNEGLAREALARREALLNQARTIQDQIDAQASNIDKLYEGMVLLEQKIKEASSKKNQMAARAKAAKSTQAINDMLSGLTGQTSMDAFERMEDKVLALEAAAEVSAEMAQTSMYKALAPLSSSSSSKGSGKDSSASDIETQFRLLEASDSVDRELEKLKANILPSSSTSVSSSSSSSSSSVIEKHP